MTDLNLTTQLPTGWAEYLPLMTSLARDILSVAGAAGFTWAMTVNADHVQMAVSLAMIVASSLWGKWQKQAAQRALRQAAASPAYSAPPKLPS